MQAITECCKYQLNELHPKSRRHISDGGRSLSLTIRPAGHMQEPVTLWHSVPGVQSQVDLQLSP